MTPRPGQAARATLIDLIVRLLGRAYLLALYRGPRPARRSNGADDPAAPPVDRYPLS